MKIEGMATNRVLIHLDNGEILDVNDGTGTSGGTINISKCYLTDRYLYIVENNDEHIKIGMNKK
ncbi:hypothetical protein LCGC14_1178380 [marine sediment metagenome]|uniref:Uncharacterized protein n=1 Tax=marine sediment metagenome TaxID=412755 RepID=A0A0F9MAP2_9ZZZZ